jgi:hypothetical protein
VVWDSAASAGSINITSALGNYSLNISIVSVLSGGFVDSTSRSQSIGYDSLPSPITCSPATGGNCSPVYNYQWQQSQDQVGWTNITASNSQNISFGTPLVQMTFFRRKTTETVSNTIAYSDVAIVFVNQ